MKIYEDIKRLCIYSVNKKMIEKDDYIYAINRLIQLLGLNTYVDTEIKIESVNEPSKLLDPILDYAFNNELFEPNTTVQRDLFESLIMDTFINKPSVINDKFYILHEIAPSKATDYFYKLSQKSNYIKTSRTSKNIHWSSKTTYGLLDLTINLSKPEKDPRDIILSSKKTEFYYPNCVLCKENVGFYGNESLPGRTNHRIIKLNLNNEEFYFQYSPYVYYNEHCIIIKKDHVPMKVDINTFKRLFDFIDLFPNYFLGSNAGLPIVGGSILNHEHYQGGRHSFPIENATILEEYSLDDVKIKRLFWPLSVIRIESTSKESLINIADKIHKFWLNYTDKDAGIYAETTALHNAITPIARKNDEIYVLDIALRNNLISTTYPLGIFHPHPENQHIKKENIGLVEVMGLGVLPGRLENELKIIKKYLQNHSISLKSVEIHKNWIKQLEEIYDNSNIDEFINNQVAIKFMKCIEDAGVFKQSKTGNKQFQKFINEFLKSVKV